MEIEESIDNIEAYAQEHLEEFEERNISIKYDSVEDLQWLVTVNILVRNNYVMQIQEDCSITDFGWGKYVGLDGAVVTMHGFGASAPAGILFKKFGFTTENVVNTVKSVL